MRTLFDHLPELKTAQAQARQFLLDVFGKASFWENGGSIFQEVPHAHLHGMPAILRVPGHWTNEDIVQPTAGWEDVWQKCQQITHYCYIETDDQGYLLQREDRYATLMKEARSQLAAQAVVEIEPRTGDIKHHGAEMMDETIRLWKTWEITCGN